MQTWVAALIAVAAITVTYFSCIRPMARGRGQCAPARGSAKDVELDQQIAALREELRVLREQDSLDDDRVVGSTPIDADAVARGGSADG